MRIKERVALIALVSLVALASWSCKGGQQNSNQQNANQAAAGKPGRWVVQFRSPSSSNVAGTNLAYWTYSSLSVVSPSVVFVAGDMPNPKKIDERVGVVVHTTDGGQNWTETLIDELSGEDPVLNSVHFVDASTGWIVGADAEGTPIMLKTTDGGATWTITKLAIKQVPTTVFFLDANTGWMGGATSKFGEEEAGGPSALLTTTDGGATWRPQLNIPVTINDIFFVDRMNGWAAGYRGTIYHTTDGGLTWNAQRSELESLDGIIDQNSDAAKNFIISGIHFADPQTGFAAAHAEEDDIGRVLGASGGGDVWKRTLIIGDKGARDVFFTSPAEGWAIIKDGHYVYHTTDGGRYWTSEQVIFEQDVPFFKVEAADASHVWIAAGGAIFYRVVD